MSLFLVQHGKSLPKDIDPDQVLSEEGISDVKRIAQVAKDYRVHVSGIKHSTKKRARQTAQIFASYLKADIDETSGLNPLDDVKVIAGTIAGKDNLMFVGHLPFMEKLTSFLITGSTDTTVFKFQTGGILCLDHDQDDPRWFIKWSLMPKIE